MSALGQKRTFAEVCVMSALPPKADIAERDCHVRFVPEAGHRTCGRFSPTEMLNLLKNVACPSHATTPNTIIISEYVFEPLRTCSPLKLTHV